MSGSVGSVVDVIAAATEDELLAGLIKSRLCSKARARPLKDGSLQITVHVDRRAGGNAPRRSRAGSRGISSQFGLDTDGKKG